MQSVGKIGFLGLPGYDPVDSGIPISNVGDNSPRAPIYIALAHGVPHVNPMGFFDKGQFFAGLVE